VGTDDDDVTLCDLDPNTPEVLPQSRKQLAASTSAPSSHIVQPNRLVQGAFVLARVAPRFRFVVELLTTYDDDDPNGPIAVQGFKSIRPGEFNRVDGDTFDVQYEDCLQILAHPGMRLVSSTRVLYLFDKGIPVIEE
jgi:hypothetical protein